MSSINGACNMPYHNWYLAGDTWACRWCDIIKQAENEECHVCGKPGIRDDQLVQGRIVQMWRHLDDETCAVADLTSGFPAVRTT